MAIAQPTKEELNMIRDAILLPALLSIAEKGRQDVERNGGTLKQLQLAAIEALMKEIHNDLVAVRNEMRLRQIKLYKDNRDYGDGSINYKYVCRGYEDSFGMLREVARADLSVMLPNYINRVFDKK